MSGPNSVQIGAFSADRDDSDGLRVSSQLTGWDDGPQVRSAIEDKSQADGGWDSAGYFSSRIVTLDGFVQGPSHAAAKAVADELLSLSPHTVHELAVENEAVGPRYARVRVTAGAVLEWANRESFQYTIQLTAPDPYKYGPATFGSTSLASSGGGAGLVFPMAFPLDFGADPGVTPGVVSVPNAGTTSYHPRLRIDGPVTNPVVTMTETGDRIAYTGTVAAGQWLDIDCGRRRVLLNGLVSMRHLVSFTGAWLAVPVGGGSLVWTADTADPASTLSCWAYEGAWS